MKLIDDVKAKEGETVENLGDGYCIIQGEDAFRFGTDAVKLSDFAVIKPNDKVMDLCTGTGIIPILLHKKEKNAKFTGLEIQPRIHDMATRSVKANGLTDSIDIILGDLRYVREFFPA